MPRRPAYHLSVTGLAAVAASVTTHATAPPLEHNYEFFGLEHQQSIVSPLRLGDQIIAIIESKSKYRMRNTPEEETHAASEQKTEISYNHVATNNFMLNPVASLEGNGQKMKHTLLLNAQQRIAGNLSLRLGYGYEEQSYFGNSTLLDQYRSVGKASIEYRPGNLAASYNLTYKSAHASPYASRDQVMEHEINLEYALNTRLKPYLKLKSIEPFSIDSDRMMFFWIGIKRNWR